jgi:hypothetical protein
MQTNFLTSATAAAISAMLGVSTLGAAQTAPPIGGRYTDAIAIPVDDPTTKNISGALFKPPGAGPFPAFVYMSGCVGLNYPPETALERTVIDHLLAKGVATTRTPHAMNKWASAQNLEILTTRPTANSGILPEAGTMRWQG